MKATAGHKPCATVDELSGNNSGDCAFCARPADGVDAETGLATCRQCASDGDPHAGVSIDELQALDQQTGGDA